jgi:O-antigen/teichoic acid export membrane protein
VQEIDEHLDPTAEISLETIKKRSVKGVVTLTGRYFILYGITAVAQIFLGIYLTTEQFGIFGVVSAIVNFLIYFADIGLAASLLQKKEKITKEDLQTTFTVQQILVITLLLILTVYSPKVADFYSLSRESIFLLYALGFSFLLSSLKTIPSVLLERELRFEKIAYSSVLENLAYNFVLVLCAWQGLGIKSFTYAVLVRGVVGLTTLYVFRPWKPSLGINKDALKKLLHFGVPYQFNTLLAVLKDDGLAIILGKIMGLEAMGLLIWAQKWAQMPLRLFMDAVTKVTFPAFSHLQGEKDQLTRSMNRSIFFISFLVFPSVVGLLVLAPLLVQIVPRYEKWIPALVPLVLVSINVGFAAVTTQITNLLNAIGRIRVTFKLMIMWTTLTWLVIPILATKFSAAGAALGYAIVGTSSIVAIIIAKRYVSFSLTETALKPLFASLIMGVLLLVLKPLFPENFLAVVILTTVGVTIYAGTMYFIIGKSLVDDVKKTAKAFTTK